MLAGHSLLALEVAFFAVLLVALRGPSFFRSIILIKIVSETVFSIMLTLVVLNCLIVVSVICLYLVLLHLAALELVEVDVKALAVNLSLVLDIAVGLDGLDEILQVAPLLEQNRCESLDVRLDCRAVCSQPRPHVEASRQRLRARVQVALVAQFLLAPQLRGERQVEHQH